ncbi:hypothetical protein [Streptomyces sp. NPDC058718]|uniref:zinc finger domain-containing protein n=1 Tax=Streptomyces sp. NPDC058718 TaxID=3346610 RepID=UPI00367428EF
MTPDQIPQLLKQVSYADPRVLPDDEQEVLGMAALWAAVLTDVPAQFAMQAVALHYASSPFPIKPSDISTRWCAVVRDRMTRHTGTFEPLQHPELHPDDEAGYRAALAAERRAVAIGAQPPNELRAITAGPAAAEVQARLDRMGTYMPASVKETLAALRPEAVERERLIRSGLADPRSVACPWGACRAPQGQRCRTNGRDRRDYHPARIEAAQSAERAAA